MAEPKVDKKVAYEAAVKEAASEPKTPPAKAKPKEDAAQAKRLLWKPKPHPLPEATGETPC